MQVKYTIDAFASLTALVNFIESQNTEGAGIRWLDRFERYLKETFANPAQRRMCANATLRKLNLKCIYFSKSAYYHIFEDRQKRLNKNHKTSH